MIADFLFLLAPQMWMPTDQDSLVYRSPAEGAQHTKDIASLRRIPNTDDFRIVRVLCCDRSEAVVHSFIALELRVVAVCQ